MKINNILIFTLIFLLFGCMKDEYDLGNIEPAEFKPTIATPYVKATAKLGEFFPDPDDSDNLYVDSEDKIYITYSDSVLSMGIDDVITISNQNFGKTIKMQPIDIDDVSVSDSISLKEVANKLNGSETDFLKNTSYINAVFPVVTDRSASNLPFIGANETFENITLSEGVLELTLTNKWPVDLNNIKIELKNTVDNSIIGIFEYDILPKNGGSKSDTVHLNGVTLDDDIEVNILSLNTLGSGIAIDIYTSSQILFDMTVSNAKIVKATAKIPSQDLIKDTILEDFSFGNGENLKTVKLSSATLNYTIDYKPLESATIELEIPYAKDASNQPYKKVINVTPNSITTGSIDLSGYELDLTLGGVDENKIMIVNSASVNTSGNMISFDTTQYIQADIDFQNIEIENAEGYFGQQNVSVSETIDFSIDIEDFDADIEFEEPSFNLVINNSFGLPFNVDLSDLVFVTDNGNMTLSGTAVDNPVSVPGSDVTTIEINSSNTNIKEILSSKPSKIISNIEAVTNPLGETNNSLTANSKLDVSIDLNMPMYVSLSNFGVKDTMDVNPTILDNMDWATFTTSISNGFPVDMKTQFIFLDDNDNVLDSLYSTPNVLAESAIINSAGVVTTKTVTEKEITFKGEKLTNIKNASKLVIDIKLSSPDVANKSAIFNLDFEMDIQIGVISKTNLSDAF